MRVMIHDAATGEETPVNLPDWDDETRTVTTTGTDGHTTTRPYTEQEHQVADQALADNARLDDLTARIERIESHLWPPPPDPTSGNQDIPAFDGVWAAGGLIRDGDTIWRNVSGVPLTTPPAGFPGKASQWAHLFVDATPVTEPAPTIPAWSASATYKAGDTVTRDGRIWRCLVAHGPERQGTWGPSPAAPTIWTDIGPA